MKITQWALAFARISAALPTLLFAPAGTRASSHMDALLITRDPSAHITDVYAFVSQVGNVKYLTAAVAVYPFEEPSIGPNKYNFDDNVLYAIHISTGADLAEGEPTISYLFKFNTTFKNNNTIVQSFLGPIENVDHANQNLTQRYSVTKVVHIEKHERLGDEREHSTEEVLGTNLIVAPNNQGLVTPHYNQQENGNNLAKEGVNDSPQLDVHFSNPLPNMLQIDLPAVTSSTTDSNRSHSFFEFLKLGIEHILTGYDHLLFLFALMVVCRDLRAIFTVVTCFTIAHSITLALANLDIVRLPGRIVEPMIAASMRVCARGALSRDRRRTSQNRLVGFCKSDFGDDRKVRVHLC
jgi:hypothetical protein